MHEQVVESDGVISISKESRNLSMEIGWIIVGLFSFFVILDFFKLYQLSSMFKVYNEYRKKYNLSNILLLSTCFLIVIVFILIIIDIIFNRIHFVIFDIVIYLIPSLILLVSEVCVFMEIYSIVFYCILFGIALFCSILLCIYHFTRIRNNTDDETMNDNIRNEIIDDNKHNEIIDDKVDM
jgi:hypothetical protein